MSRPRPKITEQQKRSIRLMHFHRSSIREIAAALNLPYHHVYAEVSITKAMFKPSQLTPEQLHKRLLEADHNLASSVDSILFEKCAVTGNYANAKN